MIACGYSSVGSSGTSKWASYADEQPSLISQWTSATRKKRLMSFTTRSRFGCRRVVQEALKTRKSPKTNWEINLGNSTKRTRDSRNKACSSTISQRMCQGTAASRSMASQLRAYAMRTALRDVIHSCVSGSGRPQVKGAMTFASNSNSHNTSAMETAGEGTRRKQTMIGVKISV